MARKTILIYLQNMMRYFKLLMKYLGFWHNQRHKLFYIYNNKKQEVYNKMHNDN